MDTVHPVPTCFGTGVDVRGGSPGRLIRLERHKSFAMHSYEKRACKPFGIHSYKIIELKVPWNEYLQKKGVAVSASRTTSLVRRRAFLPLGGNDAPFQFHGGREFDSPTQRD